MAKFKVSGLFVLKVIAFSWKVPDTIFVDPRQYPWKSVKTKNGITFSKINIFQQNLNRKCILTLLIQLYQKNWKIWKSSRLLLKKSHIRRFRNTFFQSGHIVLNLCYKELQSTSSSSLCKKIEGFIDSSYLHMKNLLWPMICTKITPLLNSYKFVTE